MSTQQSIEKVEKVNALVAQGMTKGKAIKQVGIAYSNYYNVMSQMGGEKKVRKAPKNRGILVKVKPASGGAMRAVVLTGTAQEVSELLKSFT